MIKVPKHSWEGFKSDYKHLVSSAGVSTNLTIRIAGGEWSIQAMKSLKKNTQSVCTGEDM